MTRQLLFYEHAVPVSKKRHGKWALKTGGRYAFARNVNSVPLMAVEFPNAGAEYAIVFTGQDEVIMPVAVLGVRRDENQYISEAGGWDAKYVPAFVRRYPFIFSSRDGGSSFTLCIDERFENWDPDGNGQRLFEDDGEVTGYLESVLEFLKEYQAQFNRTRSFCNKLKELDLLEPMEAQFTGAGGERRSLSGFTAVNRERLKKLSPDELSRLAQSDELELAYIHLQSMRHLKPLLARAGGAAAGKDRREIPAGGEAGAAAPEKN